MEAGTSIFHVRPPRTLKPPLPCHLSPSHSLKNPHTSLFLHYSRFAVSHAVRARNVPWKLGEEDEDEDEEDEDSKEFITWRRRPGRKRPRKRQKWWSDGQVDIEQEGGILTQLLDNLWMIQVFRAYGVFLPVILISFLLATGPKAFLMGSGIFFGLSLIVFGFNKLSDWLNRSQTSKTKRRRKRRSGFRGKGNDYKEDEDNQTEVRPKRKTYQSRAVQNDRTVYNNNSHSGNSFGGWDELVTEDETESMQTQEPSITRLELMTERKLSGSPEERDPPLLLGLLFAVFPFLGLWTDFV